jgi:hypothetical protein
LIERAHAPYDGVAVALLPHVLEAGEQQARANSVFSHLKLYTGWAKEIAKCRVMAGKSHDLTFPDRDEPGDRLAAKGDLGLAGPALGEILPRPPGDFVLLS